MQIGSSENVEKEDLNPEEEDLDKDAIDNEDIEDDPTVFLNGCWMGLTFIWYLLPSYTNIEQYSQFNRTILNFFLLFKFLIYKCVSKNDFWQDFVDFLIISKFSFPAILRTHMTFML